MRQELRFLPMNSQNERLPTFRFRQRRAEGYRVQEEANSLIHPLLFRTATVFITGNHIFSVGDKAKHAQMCGHQDILQRHIQTRRHFSQSVGKR